MRRHADQVQRRGAIDHVATDRQQRQRQGMGAACVIHKWEVAQHLDKQEPHSVLHGVQASVPCRQACTEAALKILVCGS